jgi:hypothetical protein
VRKLAGDHLEPKAQSPARQARRGRRLDDQS